MHPRHQQQPPEPTRETPAPRYADSHCHLDVEAYDEDRDAVLARARDAGLAWVLNPAIDAAGLDRVLDLARREPMVYAAAGIHPHAAADVDGALIARLRDVATAEDKVVALGEIGLDFFPRYLDQTPAAVQRPAFERQLALAEELDLPVIIHCRDAFAETLAAVEPWAGRLRGVFHCFSGTADEAARVLELGFHLSFTGPVTFKKADDVRAVAATVPPERLLLETDGPYLAPAPRRGKRNEPAFVVYTAEKLAGIHDMAPAELAGITTTNAERLFRI